MNESDLETFFSERFKEIQEFVDLLSEIELAAQSGPPRICESNHVISAPQQRILYSSLYLQLYNLVEATVSRCIEAICGAAQTAGSWRPEQLNENLRQEWVRSIARTHTELTPENRLKQAVEMSRHLIDQLPITEFEIELGGGGNWDDQNIEKIGTRVGCELYINPTTLRSIKRPLRDDLGALKLVKNRRNRLAHGSISFVECADGVAVSELRSMSDSIGNYLGEIIQCFVDYIKEYKFLSPEHIPTEVK